MGLGKQNSRQQKLFYSRDEIPRSPGHVFYDRLQSIFKQYGFDRYVQDLCEPFYASGKGRPSIPPGRYFRMHLVGYFEDIESERGINGGVLTPCLCANFCCWTRKNPCRIIPH
jgi:transposase